MKLRFYDGKKKALTLSYDDGVVHDIRFIEILNKYGIKATFNISTGLYIDEDAQRKEFDGRMKLSEAKAIYTKDHEIAIHAFTHPALVELTREEIDEEIKKDIENIEKQYGVRPRGMAYPYGAYNDMVIEVLKENGIVYGRTVTSTYGFDLPKEWITLTPTCHHNEHLMELTERFLEDSDEAKLFYVWGHSYEFERVNNWHLIEEFAKTIGKRDDIWYATNIEVYDYVKAYENLIVTENEVKNPSDMDVWFELCEKTYCIKKGETISIK